MTEKEQEYNKSLFHLMANKMRELTCDCCGFQPNDEDISEVFLALSMVIDHMEKKSNYVNTAAAALGVASGEFSNDLGYFINDRQDTYDWLLDTMVDDGILERMQGDDHVVYMRRK